LPARNLALAEDLGLDILVCCAACYSRLRAANHAVHTDQAVHAQVDRIIGRPYGGNVAVRHLLDVLVNEYGLEALQERLVTRLEGLRLAAYYGCLLVRPPEVVQFDDAENPTTLDRVAAAVGAEPVDWPYKVECCGGSLGLTRTDIVLKLSHDVLESAVHEGADALLVACPLCQTNLDLRQMQINREFGAHFDVPVLYVTQLVGLALGIDPRRLGLNKLITDPSRLLKAKALA
jgi:heterodisulfide reductase subunit B